MMCLAIPGKIVETYETSGIRMGKIDFDGVFREACLEAVPAATIGSYVIVHAGFALNVLSESEAKESLQAFRDLGEFDAGFSS